jgi:glyoxylase-like metal-dependent hydrolase (beta-lactamase superfamily II)/8-oxo-dGTP pyrophosphatase MutT (NUDIX family)
MTGTEDAVAPRPASTLVLLRQRDGDLEVLLTTRPKHLRFMGGAAVFPGGATAPGDRDPRWRQCSRLGAEGAAQALALDDPHEALSFYVCALRESFEEVGLLLAAGPVSSIARDAADDAALFLERCLSAAVELRSDLLLPAGRWVTPLGAPIRFDARFFVASAPLGWEPDPDPSEVDRCWWTTPADALAQLAEGNLLMAPPTIEMLQRLVGHATVSEVESSLGSAPVGTSGDLISVRLSPLVHVVLAPNPGLMTGPGTNTYVVGSGPTCVIDPAVDDPGYLDELFARAGDVQSVLVTHRHGDHVGGVAAVAQRFGCPVRAFGTAPAGGMPVQPVADGDQIVVGDTTLRVLHTPGHASDHLCFYLEGAATLFAGDNILGEGTAVIAPPDGKMADYLASLRRLRDLHIDRIFPGHFRPLDGGRAVIDGYLAHRRQRREAVVASVRDGATSAAEIVAAVYSDTPPHLHPIATLQVLAMLELLEQEGRVHRVEERWIAGDVV